MLQLGPTPVEDVPRWSGRNYSMRASLCLLLAYLQVLDQCACNLFDRGLMPSSLILVRARIFSFHPAPHVVAISWNAAFV